MPLPDAVQQGLGWSSGPIDDGPPAPVADAPFDPLSALHPAVAQAWGLLPPPAPPEQPPTQAAGIDIPPPAPPIPLPSAQPQADVSPSPGGADYRASPTGDRLPPAAPAPPAPTGPAAKLPSPDQQLANAHQQQASADQASMGAIGAQESVSRAQGAAEVADYQAHDEAAKKIEADRAAQKADYDKTFATKQAYVDSSLKAIDNYKIDQDKYWNNIGVGQHIGWYIAMALSGVGDALQKKGGPNPVIQMLQDKMHQGVVAQMDEREQLKERSGRAEHDLDKYQQFSQDRVAQMNLLDARNDKMLAQNLMTTAAKFKDPQAIANAQAQAAQLMQSSTEKAQKSVEFAATYDTQKKQLAVAQSANAIAGGHLAIARQAEARAQKLQDLEYGPGGFKEQEMGLKAAEEARKALADQKKTIKDQGLFNPRTAEPLLTGNGRAMMQQADQVEAASRKDPTAGAQAYVQSLRDQVTTPQGKAQVDQLEQQIKTDPVAAQRLSGDYVASLRNTAQTTEVATIADPKAREEVKTGIDYANRLVNQAAEMKQFLQNDPDITDRDGWAKLKTKYGITIADFAKVLGERVSERALTGLGKHTMDFNPDSLISRVIGKGPAIAELDGVEESVKAGMDSLLKSHGIKDGWIPSSPLESPAAKLGQGQTSQEVGAASEPGLIGQTALGINSDLYSIAHPLEASSPDYERPTPAGMMRAAENEAAGRTTKKQLADGSTVDVSSNVGLDPKDDQAVQSLIKQADSASNAKRSAIIDQIASPIIANDRPSLSVGILGLVRAEDPALYRDVLARLPPMQAKELSKYDEARNALTPDLSRRQ